MHLKDKRPQKSPQRGGSGSAAMSRVEEASSATHKNEHSGSSALMELVVANPNVVDALRRVEINKGGAGVDEMSTSELRVWLRKHWPELRQQLLNGSYQPQPVRRVSIPKPNGGTRELGIPTVVDRFIQQSLLQILQRMIDPTFSEHSHGFRPKRSAHGAVREAVQYVRKGRKVVVDVDLAKFFDRVNHDILMSRVARHVQDPRVLRLIRRYLESGVMVKGVVTSRTEGTPQGGPLSPLLANILLDEVDKELEHRGHAFVRYADDLNVYVRSVKAGERVLASLRRLFSSLRLQINEDKSAVADVRTRKFLGFTIDYGNGYIRARAATQSIDRLKERVCDATKPTRGQSLDAVIASLRRYLLGWKAYFCVTDMPLKKKQLETLDGWIRRRLRAYILRQWRFGRVMYKELLGLGIESFLATVVARRSKSYWYNSSASALQFAFPTSYFTARGLPRLAK